MAIFLILLLIALVAAAVWLLIFFANQTQNDKRLQEAENTVSQARQQASQMVDQAASQSHTIIKETQFFTGKAEDIIRKTLEEGLARIAAENTSRLDRVASHYEETTQQALASAEQAAKAHIQSFTAALQASTKETELHLEELVQQEYQKNKEELQSFKKTKMKEIEERLNREMPAIIKTIAGKAIPLSEHEQLVKSALSNIKESELL